MLKYPMHGFAKRVDDTVTRAMTILQNREHQGVKRHPPASPPKLKVQSEDAEQQ